MEDDPYKVYYYGLLVCSYSIEAILKFILLYFYVPFYDSRMYHVKLFVRSRFAVAGGVDLSQETAPLNKVTYII